MSAEGSTANNALAAAYAGLLDEAWLVIEPNLDGLTNAEYLWEPEPGWWSVRHVEGVRTSACWGAGDWRVEVDFEQQNPPPTTIAWRLMHAYDCFRDYTGQALGQPPVDWNSIVVAAEATEAALMMRNALHEAKQQLLGTSDEQLTRKTASDDAAPQRRPVQLLNKAFVELISHTAEVGTLRAMYRAAEQRS